MMVLPLAAVIAARPPGRRRGNDPASAQVGSESECQSVELRFLFSHFTFKAFKTQKVLPR